VPGRWFGLLLLLFFSVQVEAWTGISASIGEYDSSWKIDGELRPVTLTRYGIAIEDRTASGLRLGVAIGEFGLRLKTADGRQGDDYAGEYLDLRLRWPFRLSSMLTLHGDFGYAWQSGRLSDGGGDDKGIDWSRTRFGLGLQFRAGPISLRPFFEWRSLDGDVALSGTRHLFENDNQTSAGLVVDIEVEPSGFVRFTWMGEGRSGLMLSFVRAY
jgi:hypothetical protein